MKHLILFIIAICAFIALISDTIFGHEFETFFQMFVWKIIELGILTLSICAMFDNDDNDDTYV